MQPNGPSVNETMNNQQDKRAGGVIPAWKTVAGHGAHMKATRENLIIQHRGTITETPLKDLDHLLIIGGHNIQTAALATLMKKGIFVSFFESEGEPAGHLIPYGYRGMEEIQEARKKAAPYKYALTCARAAARERILTIEGWNEGRQGGCLYSGELDILDQAARELDNYVKVEEISRVDRLIGDMYYEILSRLISPAMDYKKRTHRPYPDPVNTILTFGYTMLTACCTRLLVSLHIDPDEGMLHRGKRSMAVDLCNCWKTRMIDIPALELIDAGLVSEGRYECGKERCILSDGLIRDLIEHYNQHIRIEIIRLQVENLYQSLLGQTEFEIIRF